MSKVSIKQVKDPAIGSHTLLEEFENLFNQVRERAYSLFQQRGGRGGECGDLDDWLRAERELLWTPPADVIDKDDQFRIHVAAPGFDAGEIEVTVLPETIVVRAESKQREEKQEGELLVSEFSSRKLYRRFDLPAPIDPEKTVAELTKGVLRITAQKSEPVQAKRISVASGG